MTRPGTYIRTAETRKKLSLAGKKSSSSGMSGKKHSDRAKQNMRESHRDRVVTEDTKRKISEGLMGHKHSEETKDKIRQAAIGRKASLATRQKMSALHTGMKRPPRTDSWRRKQSLCRTGKKHSEETRKKMSRSAALAYVEGRREGHKSCFKTGWFISDKNKRRLYHRSSLELQFYEILEADASVASFENEPFYLPYTNPEDGRVHRYVPDLLITYSDGTKKLVEIKPEYQKRDRVNRAKFRAATIYVRGLDMSFEIWTEEKVA